MPAERRCIGLVALAAVAWFAPSARAEEPALVAPAPVQEPKPSHAFLERKPGDAVTFFTRFGEATIYGNLDVSIDAATKGIGSLSADGSGPVGHSGWMPDISTNLAYAGIKGVENVPTIPVGFVYQLETQIDISATSGTANTNSMSDTTVKGGLTSRNSFIGLSTAVGDFKVGKTDAPYKASTARLNPFVGTWGDYAVIMGNTGGDNRVEFGTRLDHAAWYESPKVGGLQLKVLYAPGQNRGYDDEQIPAGESSCSGGNIPGSGGTVPLGCTDGGYGDAYSASIDWQVVGLYAAAAYERHLRVNRTSDLATLGMSGMLAGYDPKDIADEDAMKIGASYTIAGTTLGGMLERMNRYLPQVLQVQNERERTGWWVFASQRYGAESIHLGWAHAARTPGDPGQHNTGPATGLGTADADNQADMFTVAIKHTAGAGVTFYVDYAVTFNHAYAHYDLGAGGRGVTTDCHDAQLPALGDATGSPHCWAGGTLQGFSVGTQYKF
jgi:predicted porin